ncbi:MAG: helix-turn-helix protein [Pelotomaculum sp. PtaB.Bin104]|nr:MAG: helix-turn-helix protein [Pelotomaculum sp. PtaB.Bin104]OPY60723.1 MAG: helix-turn-helix protein [Pelotomaculum sp. PtaU1.Bin065]
MKNLPSLLITFRGEMTQKELSEKAHVPQSAISEIEAGKRIPRIDTLCKLTSALGISVSSLLEDNEH